MRSSLLPLALLAAACLAHGAEPDPAAPRRSLTVDLVPTTRRTDWDWCWDSLVTLSLCKHDLLASFFTGRPVPRACCHAADEARYHCGPFTRAFVGSLLLPRGPLAQCARSTVIAGGAPTTTLPRQRRAPPLETGTRVSGGARSHPPRASTGSSSRTQGSPEPKAETSARLPPPAPRAPSGTQGSPEPKGESSVRIPPSLLVPPKDPSGTQGSPGPKPKTTARTPAVSGGARDGSPPNPKVIARGSAGGRTRRAPEAYGAGAGAPLAAAVAPPRRKGARTARPSGNGLAYGPPAE